LSVDLDAICREGARRMLAAALEAERDAYLAAFADERDGDGRRLVVGNGRARPRVIATGAGPTRSSRPSPRSICGPRSPRGRARELPGWPWPTSWSRPPRPAGGRSTPRIWSPRSWAGPAVPGRPPDLQIRSCGAGPRGGV